MLFKHIYKNICKEYKMVMRKFKIKSVKKSVKIRILNHFLTLLIKTLSRKP